MADALLLLLKEKPIEQITISEITERADVGRVTFYRHFKSKEDLIYYKFHLIGNRLYSEITPAQRADTPTFIGLFSQHMYAVRDVLVTLYRANQYNAVLPGLHRAHLEHNCLLDKTEGYYNIFWVYGVFGILTEWVADGCDKTPAELTRMTLKATTYTYKEYHKL